MKKWILFFTSFALVVAICFLSYLYLYRAEFTSTALSKLYGVPVKVARIRVTAKDIELQNITIYNPTEYAAQPASTIAKVMVKMTPLDVATSFLGFDTTIRKITVVDPTVCIEMTNETGSESNWKTILSNMAQHIKTAPQTRTFTLQSISARDIATEIRNKAVRKHTKRPSAIHEIALSPQGPQTLDNLIYWSTQQMLLEIAQKQNLPDFATSLKP